MGHFQRPRTESPQLISRLIAITACIPVLLLVACAAPSATAPAGEAPTASAAADAWPTAEHVQDLDLTGRLVFIDFSENGAPQLSALDLATGQLAVLFVPPENGTLASGAVSPDGTLVALAYSPPAAEGFAPYGFTDLYVMPVDGTGAPQPFAQKTTTMESFFQPAWSPGRQEVYYGHFVEVESNGNITDTYTVERAPYPAGKPEVLLDHAIWPRMSPDGSTLAYVSFTDPGGPNALMTADRDGKHTATVLPASAFTAVDAAVFSPDGQSLVFSAVPGASAPALSWLDLALGVQLVSAHSLPSDLWRVPVAGGKPKRLTALADTGLYPAYSPDGTHIAFVSAGGLFVMNADGSGLVKILGGPLSGTLSWIPAD
jgi:Tol biopolymer transport system component